MTKDAKYCPKPKANKVQRGGKVIADRPFGCLAMSLISNAEGIVTSHTARMAAKKKAKKKRYACLQ